MFSILHACRSIDDSGLFIGHGNALVQLSDIDSTSVSGRVRAIAGVPAGNDLTALACMPNDKVVLAHVDGTVSVVAQGSLEPSEGGQAKLHRRAMTLCGGRVAIPGAGPTSVVLVGDKLGNLCLRRDTDIGGKQKDFSPDGRMTLSSDGDGRVRCIALPFGHEIQSCLMGHMARVCAARFLRLPGSEAEPMAVGADDSTSLVTRQAQAPAQLAVTASADGTVRVWFVGVRDEDAGAGAAGAAGEAGSEGASATVGGSTGAADVEEKVKKEDPLRSILQSCVGELPAGTEVGRAVLPGSPALADDRGQFGYDLADENTVIFGSGEGGVHEPPRGAGSVGGARVPIAGEQAGEQAGSKRAASSAPSPAAAATIPSSSSSSSSFSASAAAAATGSAESSKTKPSTIGDLEFRLQEFDIEGMDICPGGTRAALVYRTAVQGAGRGPAGGWRYWLAVIDLRSQLEALLGEAKESAAAAEGGSDPVGGASGRALRIGAVVPLPCTGCAAVWAAQNRLVVVMPGVTSARVLRVEIGGEVEAAAPSAGRDPPLFPSEEPGAAPHTTSSPGLVRVSPEDRCDFAEVLAATIDEGRAAGVLPAPSGGIGLDSQPGVSAIGGLEGVLAALGTLFGEAWREAARAQGAHFSGSGGDVEEEQPAKKART